MAAEEEKKLKESIDQWLRPSIVWYGSSNLADGSVSNETIKRMISSAIELSESLGTYIMYHEQRAIAVAESEAKVAAHKERLKQKESNQER